MINSTQGTMSVKRLLTTPSPNPKDDVIYEQLQRIYVSAKKTLYTMQIHNMEGSGLYNDIN